MKYYKYDDNGAFIEEVEAEKQPKNSTLIAPPVYASTETSCFDGRTWQMVPDLSKMSLEEARTRVIDYASNIAMPYEDPKYSSAEIDTWPMQYAEALAYQKTKELGILLKAMVDAGTESADDIAAKIIARYEEYVKERADILVRAQAYRNAAVNARSVKELPSLPEIIRYTNQLKMLR